MRHRVTFLLVSAAPTSLLLFFSSYLTLALSHHPAFSSILPFTSISLADLAETFFSLLLFYPEKISVQGLRLQWVPGHLFLPGSNAGDELNRREALLVPSVIPCRIFPIISRIHSFLFSDWRRTISLKFFDIQVPSISTKELVLLRHARRVLSRLRCNEHSLLFSFCFSRIVRIENPSCSAWGHSFQDTSHLILHCPAADSLRRLLFGYSVPLYVVWSRPWRVAQLMGPHGIPPCPHPSEGVG